MNIQDQSEYTRSDKVMQTIASLAFLCVYLPTLAEVAFYGTLAADAIEMFISAPFAFAFAVSEMEYHLPLGWQAILWIFISCISPAIYMRRKRMAAKAANAAESLGIAPRALALYARIAWPIGVYIAFPVLWACICEFYNLEPHTLQTWHGLVGLSISMVLYAFYAYGFARVLRNCIKKAAMLAHANIKTMALCVVALAAFPLAYGLATGRGFERNPDMRAMVLNHIKPGMSASEVKRLIPRKLFPHGSRLRRIDGYLLSSIYRSPCFSHKKLFVATHDKPCYELRLYADGTQMCYAADIFFDSKKKFIGLHFQQTSFKTPDGLEPQALPDFSNAWHPDWPSVDLNFSKSAATNTPIL